MRRLISKTNFALNAHSFQGNFYLENTVNCKVEIHYIYGIIGSEWRGFVEGKYLNENGYTYPRNTVGKSILWSLYPIGVYIGAAFIVGFVYAFFLIFSMVFRGQELIIEEYVNRVYSDIWLILILQQIISIGAVLPIYLIHRKYQPKPERKNSTGTVVLGVLFVLGCGAVISILQNLVFSFLPINDVSWEQTEEALSSMSLGVQIISTVILAPIVEELMFRGMILNRLMSKFPKWAAVLVSAIAFGALHMNWTQGIFAGLVGIVFAMVYVKTRSLWLCIFAHAANNLWATLLSFVEWSDALYVYLAESALAFVTLSAVLLTHTIKKNKNVW